MIQTVTGAIEKIHGAVLMHEHISVSSLSFTKAFGKKWLDKAALKELAIETFKAVKEKYGVDLIVDATPIDLGRDAELLKEVSIASGVKIVASSGYYYLPSIETLNNSADEIAEWFIWECENGIDGTGVKPGILKCATGVQGLTEDNLKKLSAMGIVQRETGLPIYVHCEHYEDIAKKQIEILTENGADAGKIIIGHTAMRFDADYLEEILKIGCYICLDQCHCFPQRLDDIAAALVTLCKKGYTGKIVLANDYCIHNDFVNRKTNGLNISVREHTDNFGYVFDNLQKPFIKMGGSEKDFDIMLCQNPKNILNI